MAKFVKGQGKREQSWEVARIGSVVKSRNHDGDSAMLPGYLQCGSELGARTQVEKLAADWLANGFVPADDSAGELAHSLAPPAPAGPVWPLRADFYIDNESKGLMLTSMAMAGSGLEEGSKEWLQAVTDGKLIPLSLLQDDPFNLRLVAGEELTEQEQVEWVARLDWPLVIEDGLLAITGGAVLTSQDYDPDDAYFESYLRAVKVPPGRYQATLYSYLTGVNGSAVLDHLAGGYGQGGPYGTWWRATRPDEVFPTWLRQWCVGDQRTDPGHESEWEGMEYLTSEEVPATMDFVLHLQRDEGAKPARPFAEQDGWFPLHEGARRPQICPRGLLARDLQGPDQSAKAGEWIYVQELDAILKEATLVPLQGGALAIAPQQLALLYQLARFSHSATIPQFGAEGDLRDDVVFSAGDRGCVILGEERQARILFSNAQQSQDHQRTLQEACSWFMGLPVGIRWELSCVAPHTEGAALAQPPGLHRYRGEVTEVGWVVNESFPPVSKAELEDALELAREVQGGEGFALRGLAEGQSLQARALQRHGDWIEKGCTLSLQPDRLSLTPAESRFLQLYGAEAFALRHGEIWSTSDSDC